MVVKMEAKRKDVTCFANFKSSRCLFFITFGVLTCLSFLFTFDYYNSFRLARYQTDMATNTSLNSSFLHITLSGKVARLISKVKNLASRRFGEVNRETGIVSKCSEEFRRNHLMTINEMGRTGNKLFQFATLIATAESTCYTAVRKPHTMKYFDEIFTLKNVEKRTFNTSSSKILRESGWSIYMANITALILPEFNWTLLGYRQSYRYFQNYSKLIKSSFQFKESIKRDVMHYLANITQVYKVMSVCLHVRRSDQIKRTVSSVAFINRALSYFNKQLSPLTFFLVVTSDDMNWCRANIKGRTVYFSPFKDAGRDLFLLTQCNHNIMTVGSFGWFGAWLNETGMVVYDKIFPGIQNIVGHNHDDYYPRNWIGL